MAKVWKMAGTFTGVVLLGTGCASAAAPAPTETVTVTVTPTPSPSPSKTYLAETPGHSDLDDEFLREMQRTTSIHKHMAEVDQYARAELACYIRKDKSPEDAAAWFQENMGNVRGEWEAVIKAADRHYCA